MPVDDVLIATDDDGTQHWQRRVTPDSAGSITNYYDYHGDRYTDPADGSGDLGHPHVYLELDMDPDEILTYGTSVVEMPAIPPLPDDATLTGRYWEFAPYLDAIDTTSDALLLIDLWQGGDPLTTTASYPLALPVDLSAIAPYVVVPVSRALYLPSVWTHIETGEPWAWRALVPPPITGGTSGGFNDESLVFPVIATSFGPQDYFQDLGAWDGSNPAYVIEFTRPGEPVPPAPEEEPELAPRYHLARQTLAAVRQPQIIVGLRAR